METTPIPTVINVDFKAKPADEAKRPFSPPVEPLPPAPFRKRTSFLPVRFFSPKRLPPGLPPDAECETLPDAKGASDTAETDAVGETPAGLILLPLPEEAPAAPVELTPSRDAGSPAPPPGVGTATEAVSNPVLPPTSPSATTVAAPEPAAEVPETTPEPLASVPATLPRPEPPAPVPIAAPAPPLSPAPNADAGSRSDEGGAAVQLTFSGEVAALRLTPSFQLGDVRLRTLSDVVSLRFVAPRDADNPLSALVAFQIVLVELDPASHSLKTLLLKPLSEAREPVTPRPRLQVAGVELARDGHAPITVSAAAQTATAVQFSGTFHLGSIYFTPSFGIATLRLELASNTVLVRVTPPTLPTARDESSSFNLAEAELDAGGRLAGLRLIRGAASAHP